MIGDDVVREYVRDRFKLAKPKAEERKGGRAPSKMTEQVRRLAARVRNKAYGR